MAIKKPTSPNILTDVKPVEVAKNAAISQVLSKIHPVAGAAYSAYNTAKYLDSKGVGGSGNPAGPGGDLYTRIGGT